MNASVDYRRIEGSVSGDQSIQALLVTVLADHAGKGGEATATFWLATHGFMNVLGGGDIGPGLQHLLDRAAVFGVAHANDHGKAVILVAGANPEGTPVALVLPSNVPFMRMTFNSVIVAGRPNSMPARVLDGEKALKTC
ncbi:MAG: hypothetical protein GC184_11065 [Rhizobiales bacterium]|nr:hypothetical protein [Hyphomicrobiales bacterium]